MNHSKILIADGGSTKTTWCLLDSEKKKLITTQGISPYFLNGEQIRDILEKELIPEMGLQKENIQHIFYYGTGLAAPQNAELVGKVLKDTFGSPHVEATHDLLGAARALCGHEAGIACILGTGSSACVFDGTEITKSNPGLGFILGDEGSGAYLGKKVIQHYLYHEFNDKLRKLFDKKYATHKVEILDKVYNKPFPNRYLANFSYFISENRSEDQIENILENGISDFFNRHLSKYDESQKYPIHFVGGVAWAYKDVVTALCKSRGWKAGNILKAPIDGLIRYHLPSP